MTMDLSTCCNYGKALMDECVQIKNELIGLKGQYDEVRKQALSESEARVRQNLIHLCVLRPKCYSLYQLSLQIESERRHEALVREWRSQIESRQADFDALQSQLQPPRDLELLKLHVTEELAGPYNAKIGSLESELSRAKSAYNGLQREFEVRHLLLKTLGQSSAVDIIL
jgi:hypothetical protein